MFSGSDVRSKHAMPIIAAGGDYGNRGGMWFGSIYIVLAFATERKLVTMTSKENLTFV